MAVLDDGYSGANLVWPGLDGLRDRIAEGQIDTVLVLSPDRLSRKYAYQILLTEEFHRHGAEIVFIKSPPATTPEEQLLAQVKGMIAEYERAQIIERTRHGKRHRARARFGERVVRRPLRVWANGNAWSACWSRRWSSAPRQSPFVTVCPWQPTPAQQLPHLRDRPREALPTQLRFYVQGVISPLLANLYMNRFLKYWRMQGKGQQWRAQIVAYADDFMILSRGYAEQARQWTEQMMRRIGLTLNEQKTSIRDARREEVDFLEGTRSASGTRETTPDPIWRHRLRRRASSD